MAEGVLSAIGKVATECVRQPGRSSLWLEAEKRYVCPDEAAAYARAEQSQARIVAPPFPTLDPRFKLVFLAAACGTLLFTFICVVVNLATTGDLPPARKELVQGMLTMAKIGFGAIVGLLGGKVI